MARHHFTPEEANELLAEVRPLAEELVARRRSFVVTSARRARLAARTARTGGDFEPAGPAGGTASLGLRRSVLARLVVVGVVSALAGIPQGRAAATGSLASSAVVGIVVGFAAQRTLGNFVAGLLIAFSQPIRLGDWIEFEGFVGQVEEIGLTYTFIRTGEDGRLVIPNEKI